MGTVQSTAQASNSSSCPTSLDRKKRNNTTTVAENLFVNFKNNIEANIIEQQASSDNDILVHRQLLDLQYKGKLCGLMDEEDITMGDPLSIMTTIIKKSIAQCFSNDDNDWIVFFIRKEVDLNICETNLFQTNNMEEVDIPSKIQHYYNDLIVQQNVEANKLKEPSQKRQRMMKDHRSRREEDKDFIKDEIWMPLLGYLTTEIVYQHCLIKERSFSWRDIEKKALEITSFPYMSSNKYSKSGVYAWILQFIGNRHLSNNPTKLKVDVFHIVALIKCCEFDDHLLTPLNRMRSIHSIHNQVCKSIFAYWNRLDSLSPEQEEEAFLHMNGDIGQMKKNEISAMWNYMSGQDRKPKMKYSPGVVNDNEFLWWLLNGVEIWIRNPTNPNYNGASLRLNHIQGISFIDKEAQTQALQLGWTKLVTKVYSNLSRLDVSKIYLSTAGTKAMIEYLFNIGDVKQMLKFVYPRDKGKGLHLASRILNLREDMGHDRAIEIMKSDQSCFRPGSSSMERIVEMEEEIVEQEETIMAQGQEDEENHHESMEGVQAIIDIDETEDEEQQSHEPKEIYEGQMLSEPEETEEEVSVLEVEEASEEEEEDEDASYDSVIEINDEEEEEDDYEEDEIAIKETSDATHEEPSSVAPSCYEESDEPNQQHSHHHHINVPNNHNNHDQTHQEDEVRCDDTTAGEAASEVDQEFLSQEEDEAHDTHRTHNVSTLSGDNNAKEAVTPLTIQLKEEKAYEADIEMEDKKQRRPLAVTFASDHNNNQIILQPPKQDDEESKDKAYEADVDDRITASASGIATTSVLLMHTPAPPSSSSSNSSLHQHHIPSIPSSNQNLQEGKTHSTKEEKAYEADSDSSININTPNNNTELRQQEDHSSFTEDTTVLSTRRGDYLDDHDDTEINKSLFPLNIQDHSTTTATAIIAQQHQQDDDVTHEEVMLMGPPPAVVRLASPQQQFPPFSLTLLQHQLSSSSPAASTAPVHLQEPSSPQVDDEKLPQQVYNNTPDAEEGYKEASSSPDLDDMNEMEEALPASYSSAATTAPVHLQEPSSPQVDDEKLSQVHNNTPDAKEGNKEESSYTAPAALSSPVQDDMNEMEEALPADATTVPSPVEDDEAEEEVEQSLAPDVAVSVKFEEAKVMSTKKDEMDSVTTAPITPQRQEEVEQSLAPDVAVSVKFEEAKVMSTKKDEMDSVTTAPTTPHRQEEVEQSLAPDVAVSAKVEKAKVISTKKDEMDSVTTPPTTPQRQEEVEQSLAPDVAVSAKVEKAKVMSTKKDEEIDITTPPTTPQRQEEVEQSFAPDVAVSAKIEEAKVMPTKKDEEIDITTPPTTPQRKPKSARRSTRKSEAQKLVLDSPSVASVDITKDEEIDITTPQRKPKSTRRSARKAEAQKLVLDSPSVASVDTRNSESSRRRSLRVSRSTVNDRSSLESAATSIGSATATEQQPSTSSFTPGRLKKIQEGKVVLPPSSSRKSARKSKRKSVDTPVEESTSTRKSKRSRG